MGLKESIKNTDLIEIIEGTDLIGPIQGMDKVFTISKLYNLAQLLHEALSSGD